MFRHSLLLQFIYVIILSFLVIWVPLSIWKSGQYLITPFVSSLISLAVIFSAYSLNRWAFRKSHKVFFRLLIGGMVTRIVLVVILILIAWRLFHLNPTLFLISLIGYYLIFQILEVKILRKQMATKSENT